MAIVLDESAAPACAEVLASDGRLLISAATLAECLIVDTRRGKGPVMTRLVDGLGLEVVAVTADSAKRVAQAYMRWGKGSRAGALNFGDCFAYELAREQGCKLLFVDEDFAATDVVPAL